MIESAAYDLIKQEGLQQGLQEGLQQGLQEGMLREARDAILDIVEVRFGAVPASIGQILNTIEQLAVLKALHRKSAVVHTLDEFQTVLAQAQ